MKRTIIASIIALLPCTASFAQQQPINHPHDTRIKWVNFDENNVVEFKGVPFTSTQLLFSQNEVVMNVDGGDTTAWIVSNRKDLPNMVFVKPTALGTDTNITVVTNKHSYYFHAVSSKDLVNAQAARTYTIKFRYPDEEQARLKAINDEKRQQFAATHPKPPIIRNSDYRFSGEKRIMPLHVFDDGRFTYFELRPNQAAPAIFAVDNKQGKESVVNTRRQGNFLVVQRLAPQFTLRNQGLVASVFNSREIQNIKQGRG